MNFGPLEFAAYLHRKDPAPSESARVRAARAAASDAAPAPERGRLTIVSGPRQLQRMARGTQVEAVSVYEAIASHTGGEHDHPGPICILVRASLRPVVLVLSSHQPVLWRIEVLPGAELQAVLLAGCGESEVDGAGSAVVTRIGGYYAFKRGSHEFRHLEREVLRCTGGTIEHFQSTYAGHRFEIKAANATAGPGVR